MWMPPIWCSGGEGTLSRFVELQLNDTLLGVSLVRHRHRSYEHDLCDLRRLRRVYRECMAMMHRTWSNSVDLRLRSLEQIGRPEYLDGIHTSGTLATRGHDFTSRQEHRHGLTTGAG